MQVLCFLSVLPPETVMTPVFIRAGSLCVTAWFCLSTAGCFVPGGGWTMRTGLDMRRPRKPSAFVELVDTRWDEYNRVATMNLDLATTRRGRRMDMEWPGAVMVSTPPAANGVPAGNGLPPGMVPEPPPAPSNGGHGLSEPHPLPGNSIEPFAPPPPPPLPTTDGPTAGRQSSGCAPAGDRSALGHSGDDDFEEASDDDEELASRRNTRFQRVSGCRPVKAGAGGTAASAGDTGSGGKPLLRPSASRLFSRPQ
jgi:hypothetical protein